MTTHRFRVLLEWDSEDQVWVSYVPALNFLSTFGETRDEVLSNTEEAIVGYMEAAQKEGFALPAEGTPTEVVEVEVMVP